MPQGVYEIGVDIPAGHWTIKAADEAYIGIFYGDTLTESGKSIAFTSNIFETTTVMSPSYWSFNKNTDSTQYDIDMKDGMYLQIENGMAIFTPFTGKPALGFK